MCGGSSNNIATLRNTVHVCQDMYARIKRNACCVKANFSHLKHKLHVHHSKHLFLTLRRWTVALKISEEKPTDWI